MEGGKAGQGMPTVVINGWGDKTTRGSSSSDSASDQFLLKSPSSSKYLKACVVLAAVAVVIATGIGLAIYFTMSQAVDEEEEILNKLVQQEETLIDLETEDMMTANWEPLEVRLEGGMGDYQGRVSANVDGSWGTVCSKNWTHIEARASCRSLGYETGEVVPSGRIGPGPGAITMSDVICPQDADTLDDCEYTVASHTCSHLHDVAVSCSGKQDPDAPASFNRFRRFRSSKPRSRSRPTFRNTVGCTRLQCFSGVCACLRYGPFATKKLLRFPQCFPLLTTTTTATSTSTTTVGPVAIDAPMVAMGQDSVGFVYAQFQRSNGSPGPRRFIKAEHRGFGGFGDYYTYSTCCGFINAP